ncbi:hypothetical protein FBY41_2934 [Humibacillus xanthopallidus]|uniref:Uncharacterized protein n=1 Tax=Humibacillus xanthopallidus TaxID=412689 RepID=A0A543HX74_9MICO|nr:hypothetical protein FBY41_2934 [Humibacillus xanthopallidus]
MPTRTRVNDAHFCIKRSRFLMSGSDPVTPILVVRRADH